MNIVKKTKNKFSLEIFSSAFYKKQESLNKFKKKNLYPSVPGYRCKYPSNR